MLINGQWTKIPAGKTDTTFIEILAPYDGKVIGAIPEASPEDVDNAISAAENDHTASSRGLDEHTPAAHFWLQEGSV